MKKGTAMNLAGGIMIFLGAAMESLCWDLRAPGAAWDTGSILVTVISALLILGGVVLLILGAVQSRKEKQEQQAGLAGETYVIFHKKGTGGTGEGFGGDFGMEPEQSRAADDRKNGKILLWAGIISFVLGVAVDAIFFASGLIPIPEGKLLAFPVLMIVVLTLGGIVAIILGAVKCRKKV